MRAVTLPKGKRTDRTLDHMIQRRKGQAQYPLRRLALSVIVRGIYRTVITLGRTVTPGRCRFAMNTRHNDSVLITPHTQTVRGKVRHGGIFTNKPPRAAYEVVAA